MTPYPLDVLRLLHDYTEWLQNCPAFAGSLVTSLPASLLVRDFVDAQEEES